MRKTFLLRPEGKHPDRVLDAVKHEIRKSMKRERRRELPEGADFLDFDCRFGADKDTAVAMPVTELTAALDTLVQAGGAQCYVELLAKPAVWQRRPADAAAQGAGTGHPAQSPDAPDSDDSAAP